MPRVTMAERRQWRGVWVVGEVQDGALAPVTLQLLGAGREIASRLGEEMGIVLMGHGVGDVAPSAAGYGAQVAYVVDHPALAEYSTIRYTHVAAELVGRHRPSIILLSATATGRDLAPRLAARLQTGLTANALEFKFDEKGHFLQINPGYGGNLLAAICTPDHRPQMVTVRPNALPAPQPGEPVDLRVVEESALADGVDDPVRVVCREPDPHAGEADISEARVIVAGGRGLKSKENFERLYELAQLLGGAVAATRPVVDEGWAPQYLQVGQTGLTVQPDIYIAFGISGAVQHLAGVRGAKTIIAVNVDPSAPIFNVADYGFVADAAQVLDALIDRLKARQGLA
ncbi:MAG: electron transfer flavoprotein subunit alpha/FixB family protein [Armatimonadetes bacterium]|nr:electron transfer flavoprotein subunit alpha/FixB family protein [Armatimonadota bacterium]